MLKRRALLLGTGVVVLFAVVLLLWVGFGEETAVSSPVDSLAALREGNRQFRNGQIETAVEIYRQGYSPQAPHTTLAYNLGASLHHLGQLPEAILWYRRGEASGDPWLRENLLLARRALGAPQMDPPTTIRLWFASTGILRWIAGLLAWLGAGFLFLGGPRRAWRWASFGMLAFALFGVAALTDAYAPRAAVLQEECAWEGHALPAGTELWLWPDAEGWKVVGTEMVCSGEAVETVFPFADP